MGLPVVPNLSGRKLTFNRYLPLLFRNIFAEFIFAHFALLFDHAVNGPFFQLVSILFEDLFKRFNNEVCLFLRRNHHVCSSFVDLTIMQFSSSEVAVAFHALYYFMHQSPLHLLIRCFVYIK